MLPLPAAGATFNHDSAPQAAGGPLELVLVLPTARSGTAEPLVTTGVPGSGDTLFIYYESPGRVRFGWDNSSAGVIYSSPVAVTSASPHRLLVSMGSLLPDEPAEPADPLSSTGLLRELLLVQFDGHTVMRCPGDFQRVSGARMFSLGANRIGSAVVRSFFTGDIVAVRAVAPSRALAEAMQVSRWVSSVPGDSAHYPGAVRLRIRFSRQPQAAADPLIVTGRTSKGDFLYVQILDAHHLRFGFDHWAVGGMVSPPVAADLDEIHELVLTMDALYPPSRPATNPRPGWVAIWLDGRRVLAGASACHPTAPAQIILGYNLIGGSTTGPVFRGAILDVQTVTPADLERMSR